MSRKTHELLAERMKADIAGDDRIPPTVGSFDDLNAYVDTNTLGGADELFGSMVTESNTDTEHQAKLDAFEAIHRPAIEIVDAWLKSGRPTEQVMDELYWDDYEWKVTPWDDGGRLPPGDRGSGEDGPAVFADGIDEDALDKSMIYECDADECKDDEGEIFYRVTKVGDIIAGQP